VAVDEGVDAANGDGGPVGERQPARSSAARLPCLAAALVVAAALPASHPAAGHWPSTAAGDPHATAASEAIAVTARVPMGAGPTGLGYGHDQLWVTRDDATVARVDPRSGHIRASTRVGRFPVRVAVGSRWAWVANSAGDSVSQLDAETGRLRRTIAVGDQPSGIALAADAVWVVCASDTRLYRIDPAGGRVVATIQIGRPPTDLSAIAAGPSGLWVTTLGHVIQISPRTNTVAASVRVRAPTDVTVGPRVVWVTSIQHRRVTRIDPRSNAVSGSFRVGRGPSGVALAMHRLWVLDNTDSTVSELDPQSGSTLATVAVGDHSYDIAAGGDAVWAQSYGDRAVYKIQPATEPNAPSPAPR
jgi:hypothetical protein